MIAERTANPKIRALFICISLTFRRERFAASPVYDNAQGGAQHFVPTLISPSNRRGGIRIIGIVRGIVPMRRHPDARAFRQLQRLVEIVNDLPIEVVVRNAEDGL